MKCAIIEDDPIAENHLKKIIQNSDFLELIGSYDSDEKAITALNNQPADLLFLDMRIGKVLGFEIIEKLNKKPIFIITSDYEEFAVEAFNHNAVDYIKKPVEMNRLKIALLKAKEKIRNNHSSEIKPKHKTPDYIFVRCNSMLNKIKISEIKYIQAAGDYVNIYTKQKRYTVHITLRGIEEKLPASKFFRLHRSYVVALDQVDFIEEGTAYLEKHPIPIGEQFKKELLKKLNLI